jgi:hypothetical protein
MVFLLLAIAFSSPALAELTTFEIPDQGWKVQLDAPPTTKVTETNTPSRYYYLGNSDRFNLSLIVESPGCGGNAAALEDHVRCIAPKIEGNPTVVKETMRASKLRNGLQISYLVQAPLGGQTVRILNTHILFVYKGKWGDLHASIVQPNREDITMLIELSNRFEYLESK